MRSSVSKSAVVVVILTLIVVGLSSWRMDRGKMNGNVIPSCEIHRVSLADTDGLGPSWVIGKSNLLYDRCYAARDLTPDDFIVKRLLRERFLPQKQFPSVSAADSQIYVGSYTEVRKAELLLIIAWVMTLASLLTLLFPLARLAAYAAMILACGAVILVVSDSASYTGAKRTPPVYDAKPQVNLTRLTQGAIKAARERVVRTVTKDSNGITRTSLMDRRRGYSIVHQYGQTTWHLTHGGKVYSTREDTRKRRCWEASTVESYSIGAVNHVRLGTALRPEAKTEIDDVGRFKTVETSVDSTVFTYPESKPPPFTYEDVRRNLCEL